MTKLRLVVVLGALLVAASARAQLPPNCKFGPGALPAQTLPNGSLHGAQIPIDHIVVAMQENRSFDHYFGQLHFQGQPAADGLPRNAAIPDRTGNTNLRAYHKKNYCEVADLDHSWSGTHREWHQGLMDGFAAANVVPEDPTGSRTVGYYDKTDLPFYYALYNTFAIGDRYFCSVLSQTFPNRFFLLAGTSFGHIRNDFPMSGEWEQRSIFNLLDEAGVSWRIYNAQLPYGEFFNYVRTQRVENVVDIDQYFTDAAAGSLPQVSFVDPIALGMPNVETDEHPPANIQVGQEFISRIVNALLKSPQWSRSALFLVYDEHGGFYDHVPPPKACVPDDIPPMLLPTDEPGIFDRYGIRVPVAVVSPYARPHFVSHKVHDHTSILRFIETRFDLPALTRRDANSDPMLEFFNFSGKPAFLTPPTLPAATIDPAHAADCDASAPAPSGDL
jgi:phospholipase C